MNKGILRFFLEFFSPILLMVVLYIVLDPFMLIKEYDSFYENGKPAYVDRNNDYVSTCTYDKYKDKYRYNSFILGNSRSRYYRVSDWLKYIDSNASCYHFDASNETLYGIMKKIQYIDKYSYISNCLIIIDASILMATEPQTNSYLFYISPQLENQKNIVGFHFSGFKTFINPRFFISYIDLKIRGEVRSYMRKLNVFNENIREYNIQWNETNYPERDKKIKEGTYYNKQIKSTFPQRVTKIEYSLPCIKSKQREQLLIIAKILKRHQANYKIMISPTYDQIKISSLDLKVLKEIFKAENVYDFSGKNQYTNSFYNYYDVNHYTSEVAADMMRQVYSN